MKREEIIPLMNRGVRVIPVIDGSSNALPTNVHDMARMEKTLPWPSHLDSRGGTTSGSALDVGILEDS